MLGLYVLHELLKKEKSFYYPYFECSPVSDFTIVDWPASVVDSCHSTSLK